MRNVISISILVLTTHLGACVTKSIPSQKSAQLELYTLDNPPVWGKTLLGDSITAGGFSGLIYIGSKTPQTHQFMTLTDRGPNSEPTSIPGIKRKIRYMLLPDFQLRWVKLETDFDKKKLKIIDEILLTDSLGHPLVGRPQSADSDETLVNLNGERLDTHLMGVDPEGLAQDSDGNIWMGEEYRPSLLKFNSKGRLLKRFIPEKSLSPQIMGQIQKKYGRNVVLEKLPAIYGKRKLNRGFEGITYSNGKIYAFLQSSLEPDEGVHTLVTRLIEFDLKSETVTGEYLYPFHNKGVDKIGDLTRGNGPNEFWTIEQNSQVGKKGFHRVTQFKLENALPSGVIPEKMEFSTLMKNNMLLNAEQIVSLEDVGYNFAEKVEGLTRISNNILIVVNDNDFGVQSTEGGTIDQIKVDQSHKTILGIITLK